MAKILVVDDEPLICSMLSTRLSRAGHDVMTTRNGREAIVLQQQAPSQILIVDIMMPEKDGLETIMHLHAENPDIKIIAISGGSRIGNVDLLELASQYGAVEVFHKPLDHQQLLHVIDKCLAKLSVQNVINIDQKVFRKKT